MVLNKCSKCIAQFFFAIYEIKAEWCALSVCLALQSYCHSADTGATQAGMQDHNCAVDAFQQLLRAKRKIALCVQRWSWMQNLQHNLKSSVITAVSCSPAGQLNLDACLLASNGSG